MKLSDLRKLLAGLDGARMCYGEPVVAEGRTVIPVARAFVAGGGGFGDAPAGGEGDPSAGWAGSGGGGGGTLFATPVGFIEVTAQGSRFQSIPDPERSARALSIAIRALPALTAGIAAVRALRSGSAQIPLRGTGRHALRRRVAGLLP